MATVERASRAMLSIVDGRRLATGLTRLDRIVAECDGGVTLHFAGRASEAVVELSAADVAEIAATAAQAQAELAAWCAARKGG